MRIVMVSDFPLRDNKIKGGISALVYYFAQEINKHEEIDFHILACLKELREAVVRKIGRTTIHYLPSSRLPHLITTFTIRKWKMKKKLKELNPDIVHLQGQSRHSYPVLNSGFLTILSVHGIMYEEVKYLKKNIFKFIRSYLYKMIEKKCLKNVDYIIASNEYAYQKIKHLAKTNKFYLLKNPVDPIFFNLEREPIKNRLLYAGKIDPRKGLEYLLDAVFLLSKNIELELHVVGPIVRQDYKKILLELVDEKKMNNFVYFKGLISQEGLFEEFRRCHILVLPSNEETSPMVIEQAMAAGIPVVATKAGGITYLIKDNITGRLVNARDSASIASGILDLIKNPDKCDYLTKNAKEYARLNFDVKKIANEMVIVYKEITKGTDN